VGELPHLVRETLKIKCTVGNHLPGAFLSIFLIRACLIRILCTADPTTSLYILKQVEFCHLCQTLRSRLSNVAKYSHQLHCINLSLSNVAKYSHQPPLFSLFLTAYKHCLLFPFTRIVLCLSEANEQLHCLLYIAHTWDITAFVPLMKL